MNQKPAAPRIATALCITLMLLAMFAPFWSFTGSYSDWLMSRPDAVQVETKFITLTNADLVDASLFEYAVSDYAEDGPDWELMLVFPSSCLIGLLFALLYRPILTLLTSVPAMVLFWMFYTVYSPGITASDNVALGWGAYLFCIAAALTLAGCIWMFIARRRWRKASKATVQQEG